MAQYPQPGDMDTISVNDLQLPSGVVARDIWGEPKLQPGLLSVAVVLRDGFASAASVDALDASTIHYGHLAKRTRTACAASAEMGVEDVLGAAGEVIREMGMKGGAAGCVVARAVVALTLPKGSAHGEAVKIVETYGLGRDGRREQQGSSRTVVLEKMRVMGLVGVNAAERTGRQPLVVTLAMHLDGGQGVDVKTWSEEVTGLERRVVAIVEETAFETLEALTQHTVERLGGEVLTAKTAAVRIHLRVAKPCAIPFAEAPVVEIFRRVPADGKLKSDGGSKSGDSRLNIIRPYVGR